jgi:5S rRNA maturation endonuclease (ribonuclease M5)
MRKNSALQTAILTMLEDIGVDLDGYRYSGDNIQIRCPFAAFTNVVGGIKYKHSEGYDSIPSFGIKISDSGAIQFNCFTCFRRGNSLLQLIDMLVEHGLVKKGKSAYEIQNSLQLKFPKFWDEIITKNEIEEKAAFKKFPLSEEAIKYNIGRGVDRDIITDIQMSFDKKTDRVVFPVLSFEKEYVGFVSHSIFKEKPKYKNELNTRKYLYLEWLIKGTTLIISEGMYDAVLIYKFLKRLNMLDKYSSVSTFGAQVTNEQIKKIAAFSEKIILMGDNDDAGIAMEKRIYKAVSKKIPLVYRLDYVGKDPAQIRLVLSFENYFHNNLIPFNSMGRLTNIY